MGCTRVEPTAPPTVNYVDRPGHKPRRAALGLAVYENTILVPSELLDLHYPATTALEEAQFTRTAVDLAVRLAL